MRNVQKIIKYVAMAFALALAVNIICGIISVIFSFTNFKSSNNAVNNGSMQNIEEIYTASDSNIFALSLKVKNANVTIETGEKLSVKTNDKNIKATKDDKTLEIEQDSSSIFNSTNNIFEVVLCIPENIILDDIRIETGSGNLTIDSLTAKKLDLELGAGNTEISNINIIENAEIDGGAGEFNIAGNSSINNLKLSIGVGRVDITSSITGSSKIDSGVGEVTLKLLGTKSDYSIIADKGLGNITIDGEKVTDSINYGNGKNIIDINGGIGNIRVSFNSLLTQS